MLKSSGDLLVTCAPVNRADPRMRHSSGVALARAPSCLSTLSAKRAASSGTTRARGADRFHWSVLPPDQSHTVAAGHTGRITRGRSLAETALRAFVEDWREQSDKQNGDV